MLKCVMIIVMSGQDFINVMIMTTQTDFHVTPHLHAQERDCQGFPQEIQRQLCHSMVLDVQNMMKLHNAANGHRSSYGITKMGLSWLTAATSSLARFEAALLVVLSRLSIEAPIKDSDLSKTELQDIPATICSQRKSIQ